jgi:hypothetical protein
MRPADVMEHGCQPDHFEIGLFFACDVNPGGQYPEGMFPVMAAPGRLHYVPGIVRDTFEQWPAYALFHNRII